ncbi:ribose-5-phosphate isomerase RpiA [Paenibacillus sp. SYP-B4298]|uniref:ribose-5-phosphate isomerase RpiA n=1 Tax=Paenibacillus sp. SYP-B4298 TaxID=2996034 RepID=UPI003FA76F0B
MTAMDTAKRLAAETAVQRVEDGMIVGLGTGSTAYYAIARIAQRVQQGLRIQAVASSARSEALALELGIQLVPLSSISGIDLTIDGADEVDPALHLIKGGGGALLREKILAMSSNRFIVIADESKRVAQLGRFPLPVEIVPFAANLTIAKLRELGCKPSVRMVESQEYKTDNGNYIVDCAFGGIADPQQLEARINAIAGVVENGLFTHMASTVIFASQDGAISVLEQSR